MSPGSDPLSRTVRRVVMVLSLVAALFLAAALVTPWLVDADRFRPRAEARLTDVLHRKVTLGRLELSLLTGLALVAEGVTIGESPAPEREAGVEITARRLVVRPAVLPLLRGDLVVRSVALGDGALRVGGRVLGTCS